ncbi:hypothetical protein EMIT0P44_60146 [Pseudomonas sp. IT-P44]
MFQFERLAQQDLGFAAPAFRLIAEALGGDAVEAVAVGAGDEEWFGHNRALNKWVISEADLESKSVVIKATFRKSLKRNN